jgi:hypothetical protein
MTSYEPYPTVEIDGASFNSDYALSSVRISSGRKDVLNQPEPSYASIELWTDASQPLDVEIADSLTVSINKGTTGTQTIFTGTISDISISLPQYGDIGSIARYNVTAVGALALLNKRLAGTSGYAKEFDGTRILNILSEAFLTEWDDLDTVTTWADLPNDVTWLSYDATSLALVDDLTANVDVPGQYELKAYPSGSGGGEANAYVLAKEAAQSGRGVLWEDGEGGLHYNDYAARALATPYPLTPDDLLANGLSSNMQWGQIVNDVTLTYGGSGGGGGGGGGSVNAQDQQSKILYGQLAASKETILFNESDAQDQAEAYLASRAYPRNYPAVFTVPLHSPTVTDATRDQLAAVYSGLRVSTNALPAVFGATFDGFVEGWEWNLTRYTADLSLFVSAYSETYESQIWLQVPNTTTWNTYNPATIWEDA